MIIGTLAVEAELPPAEEEAGLESVSAIALRTSLSLSSPPGHSILIALAS